MPPFHAMGGLMKTLMKTEIWKDIPGYEGRYQASSCGRIWSIHHNRILTNKRTGKGYRAVTLCKDGEKRRFYIHRLVALCFLAPPDNARREVNHIDLDKTNNHASNLEWVTRSDNFEHAYRNGRTDFRRPLRSDNKTGVAGVGAHSGGYQVTISHNRTHHYIGWYKELDDAVSARINAERRLLACDNT